MAITQNIYTGDGATVLYSFTFEYLAESDVKVTLDGSITTAYTFANPTTIQFNTAPAIGVTIRIFRDTFIDTLTAQFFPGSAIKAEDLNNNFTQNLYVTQEIANYAFRTDGLNPMVGNLDMNGYKIINLQSNPTNDNDAVNKLYVDTKLGISGPPGYTNWSLTASGGETVVGTTGPVLEYQVGKEQVYLNGSLQKRNTDYTADNGRTITFTPALTAGDIVMVRCVNYLAADPSSSYDYSRWTYTASGGEVSLSGGSPSLSYSINREQVFLNGALLQRGIDYTATDGTSISILGSPLLNGDMVEVHSHNSI